MDIVNNDKSTLSDYKNFLFLWAIEKVRVKSPMKRLWILSQTEKAIKECFNNLCRNCNILRHNYQI
jgi:hypothetical protein